MIKVCLHCGIEFVTSWSTRKFCNHSCSTTYNNNLRTKNGYSLADKKKIVSCIECTLEFEVGLNSSNNIRCSDCAKASGKINVKAPGRLDIEGTCNDCKEPIIGCLTRKYCDACGDRRRRAGSLNSIASQGESRRSKNEKYFFELCAEHFGELDVSHNLQMFDGWDADIIIKSLKIAVLWNGKWHYEKITLKHSVEQVQNRDRIKISKIKEYGYIPYVIKDMGSFNKKFVEEEFKKFVNLV